MICESDQYAFTALARAGLIRNLKLASDHNFISGDILNRHTVYDTKSHKNLPNSAADKSYLTRALKTQL